MSPRPKIIPTKLLAPGQEVRPESPLIPSTSDTFRALGARGGAAGRGDSKRRDPEACRAAARKRWANKKSNP